jgi:hypothetical protein
MSANEGFREDWTNKPSMVLLSTQSTLSDTAEGCAPTQQNSGPLNHERAGLG